MSAATTRVNDKETLSGHVSNIRGDIEKMGEDAASVARHVADAARTGVAEVKTRVSEAVDAVKERGQDATDTVSDFIRERPLTSIGIALGAGIILSSLLRRL